MSDCLFCKIVAGEIPSTKVYEDESCYAFKDIDPKAPTHLLVIPKKHVSDIHDVNASTELMGNLLQAVSSIVQEKKLTEKGYRLVINSGKDGGQLVPHLHVHILAERSLQWPPG